MNIVELLARQALERPNAPAIIDNDGGKSRTTTFQELDERSARLAALFKRRGFKPDDQILIFVPMCAELYVALLAVFRVGMVAMFLDPSAGQKHIDRCCRIVPPKGLIATRKAHILRVVSPALRRIPHKFHTHGWLPGSTSLIHAAKCKSNPTIRPCDDSTPALLTFTSGSTGEPKAAMRTHGFLQAQHRALKDSIDLAPGQIDLATLPVFVLANLASGVCSVIPNADLRRPGFIAPEPVIQQIRQLEPTRSAASPAFYERIVDHCLRHNQTLDSFESIFTGGAPVFPSLLAKLQRVAPNAEIVAVYGSTEAEPIAHIPFNQITDEDLKHMLAGRGLLAGVPESCVSLQIMRDHWGAPVGSFSSMSFANEFCPANTPGEIVVTGDHVLKGYMNGRGDEQTKFKVEQDTWHRTGDAGYLDENGRLWLLGRCDARIKDDNGELFPFAAECAAASHEKVRRVAAVSHDRRRILVIEATYGADKQSLRCELNETLGWARFDEIQFVKSIPVDKRHNAKIDYPALRSMLQH